MSKKPYKNEEDLKIFKVVARLDEYDYEDLDMLARILHKTKSEILRDALRFYYTNRPR